MIIYKIHKRFINLLLITIFILLAGYKVYKIRLFPDESSLFSGNSALNYRYAKMLAFEGKIASNDKMLGFPDGFRLKSYHPFLMESFTGHLYRILPNSVPFHFYLIIFISLYSSVIVFSLYLISVSLWKSRVIALISSILIATTLAASKSVFNVEFRSLDFALPFILFHLYYYLRAKKFEQEEPKYRKISGYTLISGMLLFVALAAYELVPLYLIAFSTIIWILTLIDKKIDIPFIAISLIAIIAGFSLTNLRDSYFLISIPMLLTYATMISFFFKRRNLWIMPVLSIIFIGTFTFLNLSGIIDEPHINRLIIDILRTIVSKLKYLTKIGVVRKDLGWESIFLWNNFIKSPSIKDTLLSYGVLLPIGLYGLILGFIEWKKGIAKPLERIILIFAIIFTVIYPFIEATELFVSMTFALSIAYIIQKFKKKAIITLILLLIPNLFILHSYKGEYSEVETNYLLQVVKFLRHKTEKESPILTNTVYSPTFLTYSNRPITLNSLYSSKESMKKIKEFEYKLFLSEKDFYKFCSKFKVRYFVYHKDMLLKIDFSSQRYRTNNITISRASPAYLFHFEPQELSEFILIFSNPSFRIFEVHYADIPSKSVRLEYLRTYDKKIYNLKELGII